MFKRSAVLTVASPVGRGIRCWCLLVAVTATLPVKAQEDGGTRADAERALQAYLAAWSRDDGISAASVARFYAPSVIYYGVRMDRAAVLADKARYIRHWPERDYREVPGTFQARCNGDRSLCHVSAIMTWRRGDRHGIVKAGRARIAFDFVPADGGRKIARESAVILR